MKGGESGGAVVEGNFSKINIWYLGTDIVNYHIRPTFSYLMQQKE